VFGAKMGMEAESHLEFIKRFAGNARGENLVQSLESVMVALVPADTFFDGKPRFHGILQGADAGERGRQAKGGRRIHRLRWFCKVSIYSSCGSNRTARHECGKNRELYFLTQKYNFEIVFDT
jgi:hypothetical protein